MIGIVNKSLVVMLAMALAAPARGADATVMTAGAKVTGEQVRAAIQRGVALLRQRQGANGQWRGRRGRSYPGGTTALCVLAMLNAGVGPDDPAVARGLQYLARTPNEKTYVAALKCQAFAAADLPRYKPHLTAAAQWLIASQIRDERAAGMWGYGSRGGGDNSNTQFALLGLHEAAKAGVHVPKLVWSRSRTHYFKNQVRDGGWSYHGARGSYGSMTAAAVASLYICGHRLHVGGRRTFVNGAYSSCGIYREDIALAAGLGWLGKNFSVNQNPRRGKKWLLYYLYALERVGMISGMRNLGVHDWYRQGAKHLVATQRGGGWGAIEDTAFALLFLAKGNRPVLVQKLQWRGHWNRNIHDLENLTAFIGDKLGKEVTWQTATLDLSLEDLRRSPILFVTGHEFPKFTKAEKAKLRRFVETGGTLLFEACCGKKAFADGFRAFAAEVFSEYPLRKLADDHPVFGSYYQRPKDFKSTNELEGMDVGCRTSVFFSPKALSCLWELQTIPVHSDAAFKLGTNLAAYATGLEALGDKLDRIDLPAEDEDDQLGEIPRGAVRIARLIHNGDYNSDPHAMQHLATMLRKRAKVDVVARGQHLRADDKRIFEYPVVFMHGHFAFELSEEELAALRLYLRRGGVLIADACCGRKTFDKSFREMAGKLFPEHPLTPLAADHPIYAGKVGVPLGELRYRAILAKELKASGVKNWRGTTRPPLEAITIDGRTVLLYSKYDFSCALEGDRPYSCRGYIDADGKKLALDMFLYAISY